MVSGAGRRVLATPQPSEIHRVSPGQAFDRKGKSLKHSKRARSSSSSPSPPPRRPIPSSQRGRPSQEESPRPSAPAVASSSRPSQGAEDDQPTQNNITDEEENKLVAEVMRHMLFKSHQQPNVPVRREDLVQVITRTYKGRSLSGLVISEAQTRLRCTFGLVMRELVRQKATKAGKPTTGDMKEYVLESALPAELIREHVLTPSMATDAGFVLLVVSIIKFSGGQKVKEELLIDKMAAVGIKEGYSGFKDVHEAVASVVKQRYIHKEKLAGTEGEGFAYGLAERALESSFQKHLEDFVNRVVR